MKLLTVAKAALNKYLIGRINRALNNLTNKGVTVRRLRNNDRLTWNYVAHIGGRHYEIIGAHEAGLTSKQLFRAVAGPCKFTKLKIEVSVITRSVTGEEVVYNPLMCSGGMTPAH